MGGIEEELQMVGENMKQLEISAEKAVEREEKLKDKILSIQNKFKSAEGRYEYGEMNITKLNQRIDDIEDEIYREKLKIKKVSDELGRPLTTCLTTTRFSSCIPTVSSLCSGLRPNMIVAILTLH